MSARFRTFLLRSFSILCISTLIASSLPLPVMAWSSEAAGPSGGGLGGNSYGGGGGSNSSGSNSGGSSSGSNSSSGGNTSTGFSGENAGPPSGGSSSGSTGGTGFGNDGEGGGWSTGGGYSGGYGSSDTSGGTGVGYGNDGGGGNAGGGGGTSYGGGGGRGGEGDYGADGFGGDGVDSNGIGWSGGEPSYFSDSAVFGGFSAGNMSVTVDPQAALGNVSSAMEAVFGSLSTVAATVPSFSVNTTAVAPSTPQSIAQNFNSNVNIGVAPAPGPTNQFTGQVNPENAQIDFMSVVSLSGNLSRGQTTQTYNGQVANITPVSSAHFSALGRTDFTQEDVKTLGQLIAGEVRSDVVGKIANEVALTPQEMQEVSMVLASVAERFGSDRGGPQRGSLTSYSETAHAPSQYSALNSDKLGVTLGNYNKNSNAFDKMAESWLSGAVAREYGLNVAVPTHVGTVATHYSNEAKANISWQGGLLGRETYGPPGQAHTAGTLAGEFESRTGGQRDQQQASYLSEAFGAMSSLNSRGIQSNADTIEAQGTSFAVSGSGIGLSFGGTTGNTNNTSVANNATTPDYSNVTFNGIDHDAFANSMPGLSWNGSLGGVQVGNSVTTSINENGVVSFNEQPTGLSSVNYGTSVTLSPSLAESFENAGISREEAEAMIGSVNFSVTTPTAFTNTAQQNVAATDRVTVTVTHEVASINPATGYRSNISFGSHVNYQSMTEASRSMLNEIASKVSFTLSVISGHRGPAKNTSVGGASKSQHLNSNAFDIATGRLTSAQKAELADAIASTASVKGWGIYSASVHVDPRQGARAHWGDDFSRHSIEQGYKSQPEMEAAHRSWTSGTYETRGPEETVTSAISVTPADLAALSAINEAATAHNAAQTQAGSTNNNAAPTSNATGNNAGRDTAPASGVGVDRQQEDRGFISGIVSSFVGGFSNTATSVGDVFNSVLGRIRGNSSPDTNTNPRSAPQQQNNQLPTPTPHDDPSAATTTSMHERPTMSARIMDSLTLTATAHAQAGGDHESDAIRDDRGIIARIIAWLFGGDRVARTTYTDLEATLPGTDSRPYIPILITLDESAGLVYFERGPIQNIQNLETEDMFGEDGEGVDPNKLSLLFDNNGGLIYSDGTYAPYYENGYTNDFGFTYVYFINKMRDGKLVSAERHDGPLPNNIFTRAWDMVFSDTSRFGITDVVSVTYTYVDPDTETTNNEYHNYRITLADGSIRTVAIPITTTLAFHTEQLASIGYTGDPFALASIAVEAEREVRTKGPSLLNRLTSAVSSTFGSLFGDNTSEERYADFDTASFARTDTFTPHTVEALNVYLDVPVECPNVGVIYGYVYEATLSGTDANGAPRSMTGHEARCGSGGPRTYVTEIAADIERITGLTNIDVEHLLSIATFSFNPPEYIAVIRTDEEDVIPNTTNSITFEAKVTSASGATVTDWTAGSITVSGSQQLHLRWDGTDYRQCLPFIADNGAYGLRGRSDLSLRTGNTEAEGFDVFERTGVYRIECDGQNNGEDGVDVREITVTVR